MDLSGRDLVCEVCDTAIGPNEPFRIFSGALCSEGDKLNPKTKVTHLTRSTKKYVSLTLCGREECGALAISRVWRGTCLT